MEDDLRHAQPVETLPVHMEAPERMKQPEKSTKLTSRTAMLGLKLKMRTVSRRGTAKSQISESLSPTDS